MADEGLHGVGMELRDRSSELSANAVEKRARELLDVFAPLAERRYGQRDHGEPVVEVGAEAALFHLALQVAVRRRHDADVDLDRLLASHAADAPVLEDSQELHLEVQRHLADLVEEDGAAVRELEVPAAGANRPGEGSFLVSEELAFEKAFRKGAAVHGDERTGGTRALRMDGTRETLFANPGLAEDEEGAVSFHHPAGEPEELLHRRTRGREVIELRAASPPWSSLALRERDQRRAQDIVLETESEHRESSRGDELRALLGKVLGAQDHDRGMLGKRFEGSRRVLTKERALQEQKVVVAVGDALEGGLHAPRDLRLDSPASQELAHPFTDGRLGYSQQNSDHDCRSYRGNRYLATDIFGSYDPTKVSVAPTNSLFQAGLLYYPRMASFLL